jgi:uncharacterized membrane protein YvbJ
MQCPQCGHTNNEDDKFCGNCGARLHPGSSIPQQFEAPARPEPEPPVAAPVASEPTPEDPGDPEWRMASLPEEEIVHKRRTWLWVLVGLVLLCVLIFCGFSIFLMTPMGQDFANELSTRAAEVATEAP